jgi:hypothetical protein
MLSGLVSHFSLPRPKLRAFLMAVSALYNDVPYHNFNHAVHVLHGVCLVRVVDVWHMGVYGV